MWSAVARLLPAVQRRERISVDDHGPRLPELKGIIDGGRARGLVPVLPDRTHEARGTRPLEGPAGAASVGR